MRIDPDKLTWEQATRLIQENTEEICSSNFVTTPMVSVSLVTYKHGAFLRQAIEGILAQETRFPVEILIGEDASPDDTRDIAVEFQSRYPDRIRLLLSTNRLGAITGNGRLNHIRNLLNCRGKYIAMIEGDDYWTDPAKLQQQVDYLESHPTASACFHDSDTVDQDGQIIDHHFKSPQYAEHYTQCDCFSLCSNYATASLMFRSAAILKPFPSYILQAYSDELLDIFVTETGTLDYIPGVMSCYRIHAGGVWQGVDAINRVVMQISRSLAMKRNPPLYHKYSQEIDRTLQARLDRLAAIMRQEWFDSTGPLRYFPLCRSVKLLKTHRKAARLPGVVRTLLRMEWDALVRFPSKILGFTRYGQE